MSKIFFTGGGTAGHVTPNIALIEALQQRGWKCEYVGSNKGPEADLIAPLNIPFHSIQSGKLRRYFSWQNFIDPFFIVMGCIQSFWLCLILKPDVVFSKGGFVAVPIVFAAWICRIPVISHESDITPGLANKLSLPFSRYLCVNFPETLDHLPSRVKSRVVVTGSPLRSGLRDVSAKRGRACLNIDSELPVLFVVGGSLGSMAINQCIWQNLGWLTKTFEVVHVVGSGNLNREVPLKHYHQFEYLVDEYGDVLACANVVLSRAGANAIYELLAFQKRHVLVPLTAAASRGDQLMNARIMKNAGVSEVVQEADLSETSLRQSLEKLANHPEDALERMATLAQTDAIDVIIDLITSQVKA
jgi:UDP-N-acetylglucosamine--N-acetylmuramyl-(pentapeptide) pyrophosphoryl-undecaprenol N-acetylglucosamine transferase